MALSEKKVIVSDKKVVENRVITAAEALAEKLTLTFTPDGASKVTLTFPCGTQQIFGADYTVTGDELIWGGFAAETIIEAGDSVIIEYFI